MNNPPSLISVRAAVVLLLALVVGLVAGSLGFFATGGVANAILIGGAGAGAALALFHSLIDRR